MPRGARRARAGGEVSPSGREQGGRGPPQVAAQPVRGCPEPGSGAVPGAAAAARPALRYCPRRGPGGGGRAAFVLPLPISGNPG